MSKPDLKNCKSTKNGLHEYAFHAERGEECKHCGTPRAEIEGGFAEHKVEGEAKPILSPFMQPAPIAPDGMPIFNSNIPPELIPSQEAMEEIKRRLASHKDVPNHVFQQVLRETNSKAAIIITFDKEIEGQQFVLTDFHISAAQVDFRNIRGVFKIILDALAGKLGGAMEMREIKDDEPPKQ